MMNKYFINIKVDREERPDVDRVYMTYLQVSSIPELKTLSVMLSFQCLLGDARRWWMASVSL